MTSTTAAPRLSQSLRASSAIAATQIATRREMFTTLSAKRIPRSISTGLAAPGRADAPLHDLPRSAYARGNPPAAARDTRLACKRAPARSPLRPRPPRDLALLAFAPHRFARAARAGRRPALPHPLSSAHPQPARPRDLRAPASLQRPISHTHRQPPNPQPACGSTDVRREHDQHCDRARPRT